MDYNENNELNQNGNDNNNTDSQSATGFPQQDLNDSSQNDSSFEGAGYTYQPPKKEDTASMSAPTGNPYQYASGSGNPYMGSPLYTETYRKDKKKNRWVVQLVAVSLISSMLGGFIVGAAYQFGVPLLQPAVSELLGKSPQGTPTSVVGDNGIYKKVEIEKSNSPVTAIAEKVSPSIVGIRVSYKTVDFFSGAQNGTGEGSGIVIRENGYILTNYHVIAQALANKQGSKVEVILPSMKDKPYTATIVGSDYRTDLAVLKIEATGLPVVEFADSDQIKVGELAVAIGNPGGMEFMGSVTVGYISGLNRTVQIDGESNAIGKDLKLLQTDAAINPGNSGGALVNSEGKLIGVNNSKIGGGGYEGLGFAIPSNTAKQVADSLVDKKYVTGRPFLGISMNPDFTEAIAKQYDVPFGILVDEVIPLSGAWEAGIQKGDVITKFDGVKVTNLNELDAQKNKHKPGDEVKVELYRDNKYQTLKVKLSEDKGETN